MIGPTDREYTVAGFCEVLHNKIPLQIAWEAISLTRTGKEFDEAIQAAVQAQEQVNTIARGADRSDRQ